MSYKFNVTIILIIFSFCIVQSGYAEQLVVMTEELAPFGYTENGKVTGLSVEIVQAMLKKMGCQPNIKIYPWARAYYKIQHEPERVLFSMGKNEERAPLFKWVGPLIEDRVYFYKRTSSSINITSLNEAKIMPYDILVSRDFPEHKHLKQLGFENLFITTKPSQGFKMLMAKRGDLIPAGEVTVGPTLKTLGIDPTHVKKTDVSLFSHFLYIAMSKDTPDNEVQKWQKTLDKMKASGEYQKILNKYLLSH